MFHRIVIGLAAVLVPLTLIATASPAGGAVGSPRAVWASTAAAAAQPTLRTGSRGAAVVSLQKRLIALRYFDVARADGVFGQNTYHAVIAFQKVQGLSRDGIVGAATWGKLSRPYVPVPRYRLATASLEVNLAKQVIYYVRGGVIQRIIDSSTGSGAWYYSRGHWARAVTPVGRFRVYWRYNGWQSGPLGSLYRPNYFYGGYAVHGMTSVPAYPASHGCVRMTVPTMDRMWSSLWTGMPVAIYRSLPHEVPVSGDAASAPPLSWPIHDGAQRAVLEIPFYRTTVVSPLQRRGPSPGLSALIISRVRGLSLCP